MDAPADKSNGYEAIARTYAAARRPGLGQEIVREWALAIPRGAAILDLGCGSGAMTQLLLPGGFSVCGVDASPTMIALFRERFPGVETVCAAAEESNIFGRTFDGVIAWGLIFLLPPDTQRLLIGQVASALVRGGRFLFTAPREACTWRDSMTGLRSVSLGREVYREELRSRDLVLVGEYSDEGQNHYYSASKL